MPCTTPLEYSVSFPPRFTHGSMGCRTCFLPIFSEAAFFPEFFSLCTSPSRELKSSGMESPAPKIPKNNVFFSCGSGHTPFVVCVVTVAWGFINIKKIRKSYSKITRTNAASYDGNIYGCSSGAGQKPRIHHGDRRVQRRCAEQCTDQS